MTSSLSFNPFPSWKWSWINRMCSCITVGPVSHLIPICHIYDPTSEKDKIYNGSLSQDYVSHISHAKMYLDCNYGLRGSVNGQSELKAGWYANLHVNLGTGLHEGKHKPPKASFQHHLIHPWYLTFCFFSSGITILTIIAESVNIHPHLHKNLDPSLVTSRKRLVPQWDISWTRRSSKYNKLDHSEI